MKTISASKARNNLYKILDEVKNGLKSYKTLDILSDNKLVVQILKSQEEIKNREYLSEDGLIKELNISTKELK